MAKTNKSRSRLSDLYSQDFNYTPDQGSNYDPYQDPSLDPNLNPDPSLDPNQDLSQPVMPTRDSYNYKADLLNGIVKSLMWNQESADKFQSGVDSLNKARENEYQSRLNEFNLRQKQIDRERQLARQAEQDAMVKEKFADYQNNRDINQKSRLDDTQFKDFYSKNVDRATGVIDTSNIGSLSPDNQAKVIKHNIDIDAKNKSQSQKDFRFNVFKDNVNKSNKLYSDKNKYDEYVSKNFDTVDGKIKIDSESFKNLPPNYQSKIKEHNLLIKSKSDASRLKSQVNSDKVKAENSNTLIIDNAKLSPHLVTLDVIEKSKNNPVLHKALTDIYVSYNKRQDKLDTAFRSAPYSKVKAINSSVRKDAKEVISNYVPSRGEMPSNFDFSKLSDSEIRNRAKKSGLSYEIYHKKLIDSVRSMYHSSQNARQIKEKLGINLDYDSTYFQNKKNPYTSNLNTGEINVKNVMVDMVKHITDKNIEALKLEKDIKNMLGPEYDGRDLIKYVNKNSRLITSSGYGPTITKFISRLEELRSDISGTKKMVRNISRSHPGYSSALNRLKDGKGGFSSRKVDKYIKRNSTSKLLSPSSPGSFLLPVQSNASNTEDLIKKANRILGRTDATN